MGRGRGMAPVEEEAKEADRTEEAREAAPQVRLARLVGVDPALIIRTFSIRWRLRAVRWLRSSAVGLSRLAWK